MVHDPDDPAVKASYEAMINETRDQYRCIRANHPELQLVPNEPGENPYAESPRLKFDSASTGFLHDLGTGLGTAIPSRMGFCRQYNG
jgi:hypothetical protein